MAFADIMSGLFGSKFAEAAPSPMTGNYAEFFRPILEAVAAEAQRKSDPVQRLYDVGGAIFDSASHGTPFGRNLAAADESRSKAIQGAGNLFLQILGHERQAQEFAASERRHVESMGLQRERMAQDANQFKVTTGLSERRLDIADQRERRQEEDQKRRDFQTTLRTGIGDAGKDLTPEGKGELERRLRADKDYQASYGTDARTALDRFNFHYADVSKDPRYVKADPGAPTISRLQRALTQAKTPDERKAIQTQIDEEMAKAEKVKIEAQKAQGEMKLLDRASKSLDESFNKLAGEKGVQRDLLFSVWTNAPRTEGRQIRNAIQTSLMDYVFARSGKQVAVAEIDRWMKTYMPSYLDDDATVRQKITNLRQNLETLAQQHGAAPQTPSQPKQPKAEGQPTPPAGVTFTQRKRRADGSYIYRGSDGKIYDESGREAQE